jgi:hypothetical protein
MQILEVQVSETQAQQIEELYETREEFNEEFRRRLLLELSDFSK